MKVLHVIGSMDPKSGGPCQGIRNSIKGLKDQIDQREVVSLDDPGAAFLGQDPFVIYPLGPANNPWKYSPRLKPWLDNNIEKYDVIIINGLWLYLSFAVYKSLQKLKHKKNRISKKNPKFFIWPHGMLDPYFQKAPERKLKAIRNWLYWKLIERHVVNNANGLLFTCETELRLARESFSPYHPKKEINVGYGIEAPPPLNIEMNTAFKEKCAGLNDRPFLLFISRIHQKKGVDLLIKAYQTILNKYPSGYEVPVLIIAGPGLDTAYGQNMYKLVANDTLLKKNVFFPGMLEGSAKWGALYGCEAFVLPSHQENFGIAVVEALACSRPVLISNQVNIWMEILAGGAGIVANDSLEGTLKLLNTWQLLPKEKKQIMTTCALNTFVKKFSLGPPSKKFLEVLLYE